MKKLMIFLLLASCSVKTSESKRLGEFLNQIQGSYTMTPEGKLWLETKLSGLVIKPDCVIHITQDNTFMINKLHFEFLFLEPNHKEYGVFEFVFNKDFYFIALKQESNNLYVSPDGIQTDHRQIGRDTSTPTMIFAIKNTP